MFKKLPAFILRQGSLNPSLGHFNPVRSLVLNQIFKGVGDYKYEDISLD
jgi:hypothetical protein